jgi:hypothetical protein
MAGKNTDWSREEHILAFNLYCKIPFGQIHMHNPRVIQLDQFTPALPARDDVAQASRRQGLNHAPGRCMNPPPGRLRHGGGCAQALNPRNGLCLNALHDRAFDRHLMWIEDGYIIRFSRKLTSALGLPPSATASWLTSFDGARLLLPKQFAPAAEFLKLHAEKCLGKQLSIN